MKINILTLGCPKNQADTNRLLGAARARGVEYTTDTASADVIMVNTCGFIEEAKRESIDEILRLASQVRQGQRLLVFGCLAQRYAGELKDELPEVDAMFGVEADEAILDYIHPSGEKNNIISLPSLEGLELRHSVPLKVAEGCDRGCTFCAIPSIRGPLVSRDPARILADAGALIKDGAREIMLVAQDLTSYEYKGLTLAGLLRELSALEGDFWLRPMYYYPTRVELPLLEAMAQASKVCGYVDMPVQHSEDSILRAMGRPGSREEHIEKVKLIRDIMPDVALRTSVIVGFPGEGDHEFASLLEFLDEARFDWVGAFRYSPEEGTPASDIPAQVDEEVKAERLEELLEQQAGISGELNRRHVGKTMRVLIDEVDGGRAIARTEHQAPDIDGHTIVNAPGLTASGVSARDMLPGQFQDVRITASYEFDLEAEVL